MHPSAPMPFSAMCEGWRGRSGGGGPNQTKKQKQNQTKAHETRPAQCKQRKLSSPKKSDIQKHKSKTKQKRMKHALLNAKNANSAAQSNATITARCIRKHLPLRFSSFK
jgi:hypothetical protein